MRAQDGSLREGLFYVVVSRTLQTQSKCPFRACIILGLDSAQPRHDITRLFKRSPGNVLVVESPARNV